jgi:hypothetical protein
LPASDVYIANPTARVAFKPDIDWVAACRLRSDAGALGYFGDARRAAVGTELIERVTASGSPVIGKLGETRAGELAIHRFLSAASVACKGMRGTLAGPPSRLPRGDGAILRAIR